MRSYLLLLVLCFSVSGTPCAQTIYQGYAAGTYPVRLTVASDRLSANYRGDAGGEGVELSGGCPGDSCTFRGVDTALVVSFTSAPDTLETLLALGDGRRLHALLRRVDARTSFPAACGEGKWLRAWGTVGDSSGLSLAALSGGVVRGTLYLGEALGSFRARGALRQNGMSLRLTTIGGEPTGALELTARNGTIELSNLRGRATLAGDTVELTLLPREELLMACLQADGERNILYPILAEERANFALEAVVRAWWDAFEAEGNDGLAWFEPARFDGRVLSGWFQVDVGPVARSFGINVDREKDRFLAPDKNLGLPWKRRAATARAFDNAVAAHPLADEPEFADWVRRQTFDEFVLYREGIGFGTANESAYGQLSWLERFDTLAPGITPPAWLRF